ncbi:putative N-acetylmannosaminyltransferase [compost metagenome]
MQNNQAILPAAHNLQHGKQVSTDFQRHVVCLLGLPFDVITTEQAVDQLAHAAQHQQRCFLSTPNLNFAVASLAGGAFRDSVIRSDLSVADGMPLVWIARLLGLPVTERVAGSTLFERLRARSGTPLRVYFFGGPDGVAAAAAEKLNASASGLVCVGHASPGFGSVEQMSSSAIIDHINASQPDFVVVALGAKKGQAWIEHNLPVLNAPLISHLGAVVNFVAGTVARAPRWVQGLGAEWLWRIWEEPALWRRYWHDGLTLLRLMSRQVLPCAWAVRRNKIDARKMAVNLAAASIHIQRHDNTCTISASGAWAADNLGGMRQAFVDATSSCCDIRLDFSAVTHIDSEGIALLMLLYGHQSKVLGEFSMLGVQPAVRRTLRLFCADYLLQAKQPLLMTVA